MPWLKAKAVERIMHSIFMLILLAFLAQAHARELVVNHPSGTQHSTDEVADKVLDYLSDRTLRASSRHQVHLDHTNVGKSGRLATISRSSLGPSRPPHSPYQNLGNLASHMTPHRSCLDSCALQFCWRATDGRPMSRLRSTTDELAQACVCGNIFMEDARFCRKCGKQRPLVDKRADVQMTGQPQRTQDGSIHVHFGAGKIGLGLVLPSLVKGGGAFCIINRPSATWAALTDRDGQGTDVLINGESVLPGGLQIITCKLAAEESDGILGIVRRGLQEHKKGFLVLCQDPEIINPLLEEATSFSCALGAAVSTLVPLLNELSDQAHGSRPALYACENDHKSVEDLQVCLRRKIEVVPCMVDRICSGLTVAEDGGAISVEAEEYEGSIVFGMGDGTGEGNYQNDDAGKGVALGGASVQIPEKELHARYLYRKKLLTVNGMHTVIAFISLRNYARQQGKDFEWPEKPVNTPLVDKDTLTESDRSEIWAWAVAQLLVLMREFGVDTMLQVHKIETPAALVKYLLEQQRTLLDRFFSVPDTTGRVLGGGVNNRYEGRLVPISQVISTSMAMRPGGTKELLLKEAGLQFETLKETLAKLVEDAMPFALADKRTRLQADLQKAIDQEREAIEAYRRRQMFQEIDTNGDGELSKEEFAVVAKQMNYSESEIDAIFASADKNGDGKMDFAEFKLMIQGQ